MVGASAARRRTRIRAPIRPDGYVAWVVDKTDDGLTEAPTKWFGARAPLPHCRISSGALHADFLGFLKDNRGSDNASRARAVTHLNADIHAGEVFDPADSG